MKQTAVEWFQDQIIKIVNGTCELSEIQIFEKAKEMEKEQIIDACNQTDVIGLDHEQPGEQYYKQTFNTKEK